eukprot:gene19862-23801_t
MSHYAKLMKPPTFDKASNSYYIPAESLSEYINPNEWKLDEIATFRRQMQELVGITPGSDPSAPLLSKKQISDLVMRYTSENINVTLSTLTSLSSLVESLPNMQILDNIAQEIGLAISSLEKAHEAIAAHNPLGALEASKIALASSENAFFDKNMISQLYFPDEHKYAVYTPLFVPVFFPIISGILQEYKHWRQYGPP